MVFSSHIFLFYFLPATLFLYYVIPQRGKHAILTLLSYVFYGWANPLFVVLLFTSTVIDYCCGLAIAGSGPVWLARITRRHPLVESWRRPLTAVAGTASRSRRQRVTLPLGISFYTFQSMSYTIDVYRGRATALRSFVDFACYVSMFPQLVAGPIVRFSEIADQLVQRSHTVTKCARGVAFISVGLAKKILLANPCGQIADLAFDAGSIAALDAWYGVTAYAFQIYFDFSAYSDMAIGLGLMLGFVFPKNFDSPYRSRSITEFWRRWHISLSTWLRDYLYVPLGGNRRGPGRTYINLAVVMLLGGLWHGAAWNFVIWGGLHGALLAGERLRGRRPRHSWVPEHGRVAATFVVLLFTWVFFRAADLPSALRYLESMLGLGAPTEAAQLLGGILYQPYYLGTFVLAGVITWTAPQTWDWTRQLTAPRAAAALALLGVSMAILSTQAYNPFIYFIF